MEWKISRPCMGYLVLDNVNPYWAISRLEWNGMDV
jgi:hypothetical protein